MPADVLPPAGPSDSDPELNALVEECLARFERDGAAAVEDLCRRHPARETALRRRIGVLRAMGLLGAAGGAGEASGSGGAASEMPERLGDFRLIEKLGGGGMGVVFLAEQESLGRRVALKLIRPEHLYFPGARDRFMREAEAVARLQHPGIVPIHLVGEQKGVPYYAMELVRGCSLAQALEKLAGRDPSGLTGADFARAMAEASGESCADDAFGRGYAEACLRVARQIADALAHAHRRGVLHRDLKPSNVMLTADGRALLVDFGLAAVRGSKRITRSGSQFGSLYYIPPERLVDGEGDGGERGDVYGLGVTLYEMLALRPPFAEEDASRLQLAILSGAHEPLRKLNTQLPWDAETVCHKAIELQPERRYADAAAFARDLSNVLELRPIEAVRPGPLLRARRYAQRHPARALAALFAVVLAFGGPLAFAVLESRAASRLQRERDATERQRALAQSNLDAALEAVDSMLVELGTVKLQDVPGMQKLRRALLEEAMSIFGRFVTTQGADPRVRFRVARTLRQMGTIQSELGEYDGAIERLRQAADAFASMPAGDGAESAVAVRIERARVHQTLATVFDVLGDVDSSEREAGTALDLWRALDADAGRDREIGLGLAETLNIVGRVQELRLRNDARVATARWALRVLADVQALAPDDPVVAGCIASAQNDLARGLSNLGDEDGSRDALRAGIDAAERAVALDPVSTSARAQLGTLLFNLGQTLHVAPGASSAAALPLLRRGRDAFESLRTDFPDSPAWAMYVARTRNALAEALLSDAGPARAEEEREAEDLLRSNVRDLADLARRQPTLTEPQRIRASTLGILGDYLSSAQRWDEARGAFRESQELLDELIARDPDRPFIERLRAMNHESLAALAHADGDLEGVLAQLDLAVAALARARDALPDEPFLRNKSVEVLRLRGLALLDLDRAADAAVQAEALDRPAAGAVGDHRAAAELYLACAQAAVDAHDDAVAEKHRARAIEALERAVDSGEADATALRDDDAFAKLQEDPRFQALLRRE